MVASLKSVIETRIQLNQNIVLAAQLQSYFPKLNIEISETAISSISCQEALIAVQGLAERDMVGISEKERGKLLGMQRFLLHEIVDCLTNDGKNKPAEPESAIPSLTEIGRLVALTALLLLGAVFAACQGMTGLMALISYFSLSQTASIVIMSIFSCLAVFVYLIYDFQEFSVMLGAPLHKIKSWLKDILETQNKVLEGFQALYDMAKQEEVIEDTDFDKYRHAFTKAFKAVNNSLSNPANVGFIKSNAEIKSWLVWLFKNMLANFAMIVWALSGYFVGKSAAAIILGFCSYETMVLIAEPLTFGLSAVGLLVAGALFYKGEYKGIINHVNYWAGIPENFDDKFSSRLAECQRAEEILDDKFELVYGVNHQRDRETLLADLGRGHQDITDIAIVDEGLADRVEKYTHDYQEQIRQSSSSVLASLLTRQQNLAVLVKLYRDHAILNARYQMIKARIDHHSNAAQYTSYLEEIQRRYEVYVDLKAKGLDLLNNPDEVREARDSQWDCLKMIAQLRDHLDKVPNQISFFKCEHKPLEPAYTSPGYTFV